MLEHLHSSSGVQNVSVYLISFSQQQTAIVSVCSSTWSVFVTEMQCVYCDEGTKFLDIKDTKNAK
jgi:hypothetical protein